MFIISSVKQQFILIKDSMQEFKKVFSLCFAAIMTALNTIISTFRIVISNLLEINFASLAVGPCALYCGPMLSATVGAIADILKFIARPSGPFFPGFTINEFVLGFIYGMFFYKKEVTLKRVFAARVSVVVIINLCLTPIWLHMLYGNAFMVLVSARLLKNIVLLPVDTFLLYFVMKKSEQIGKRFQIRSR